MRKAKLVIGSLLLTLVTLSSFKSINEKHYGGSASASGKVTYVTDYEKTQGRKVGDIEPIDVTVNCRYDNDADAKEALKDEIEEKAASKNLKLTTNINYDISSCD